MKRQRLILAVCVFVVGAMVSASLAQAQPDPSFGQDGIVDVNPPQPPQSQEQTVSQMTAAENGSSLVLLAACSPGKKLCSERLVRYNGDGSLDPSFGEAGGAYALPMGGRALSLRADSLGRPLLAEMNGESGVIVRRLTPFGTPDPGFGVNGSVEIKCRCGAVVEPLLVPGSGGALTVVLPVRHKGETEGSGSAPDTTLTLVNLEADGYVNPVFGKRGRSTIELPGEDYFGEAATTKSGALYLRTRGLPTRSAWGGTTAVIRVSAAGRLDKHFDTTAQHAITRLEERLIRLKVGLNPVSIEAVLLRSGGEVELLGSAREYEDVNVHEKGFAVRLHPNGRLDRTFGKNGLRLLLAPVRTAALGSEGSTLALTEGGPPYDEGGSYVDEPRLIRMLADGRIDPNFGTGVSAATPGTERSRLEGELVPDGGADYGFSIVHQGGRRALVLDRAAGECAPCGFDSKLIRFLEGEPKRR